MFCNYCGKQNDDGVRFCTSCGKELQPDIPSSTVQQQPYTQQQPAQKQYAQQPAQYTTQQPVQQQYAQQPAPYTAQYQENSGAPVQIPGNFVPDPNYVPPVAAPVPVRSNPLLGIIGAVLFGLIACVVWVLIGMLGYIAYIGGLLMGFCTVTGYRIFGKKFDVYGIICCIIVILLAVFSCNVIIETISLFMGEGGAEAAQLLGFDGFFDVLFNFFSFASRADMLLGLAGMDQSIMGEFILNTVIGYVLSGIGFLICAIPQFRARNVAG